LNLQLKSADILKVIQPHRTTLVDVTLLRLPSEKVFRVSRA